MKTKIVMYVYGDITTDARVNRAAEALSSDYSVTLISTDCGKNIKPCSYTNVLVGRNENGIMNLFRNIFYAFKQIQNIKPEIVYCHDYYSTILITILLLCRYKCKVVYDAHELIIPEQGIKDRRLLFFYWFEKIIIKKVALCICASESRCDFMVSHYKLKTRPIVIRNISQLSINEDLMTQEILSRFSQFFCDPAQTIVYAGVVTKKRKITELAKAVIQLAPNYKLLIVGNGDALQEIKELSYNNRNVNMCFTGTIPYDSLGAILSKCDLGFVYYPTDTLNNKYCASNKVFEYASVSLPMISNENITIKEELETNHIGVANDNIIEAIKNIANRIDEYKDNCIKYTKKNPWSNESLKLLNAIKFIKQ